MANVADKLDFFVKNGLNVLFVGKQGIGKSTLILDCFKRNKLHSLYFSASTMDPWVDFVGIPKERTDKSGESYIDLVRPKAISDDRVEALFFDEFNRAPKKIRNAVMELIQFKSINGRKFPNLKIVWAAINPDDVEDERFQFDVEKLDPAQKDRFQIIMELPYQLDIPYFSEKFGEEIANSANEWWLNLDKDTQNMVSPRRVDYALELIGMGGDVEDCLPAKANIKDFKRRMKETPLRMRLDKIYKTKDVEAAGKIVNSTKDLGLYLQFIEEMSEPKLKFFVDTFEPEMLALAYKKPGAISSFIHKNKDHYLSKGIGSVVRKFDSSKLVKVLAQRKEDRSKIDTVFREHFDSVKKPEGDTVIHAIATCIRHSDSRKDKRQRLLEILLGSFPGSEVERLVKNDSFYNIINTLLIDNDISSFDDVPAAICSGSIAKIIKDNADGRLLL